MALVINSNIQSLNAQRNLTLSTNEMNTSMERLSSGKRINSAADDAAGLAISTRMSSQVRGLDQAVRNANDGLSLIQTAEGALEESTNILQRMRELAIQAANGIYTDGDRATLDAESQQLIQELDRIAETTSFNGQNILDGSLDNVDLQVGAEANEVIGFGIPATDTQSLGMGSQSVDVLGAANTLVADASVIGNNDILINGQSIMAIGETFTAASEELDQLIDKINTNVNGITASTVASAELTTTGDGVLSGADTVTISVEQLDGTTTSFSVGDTESMDELVDGINAAGNGLVSASLNDDNELVVSANDATSVTVADGSTGATALGAASTVGLAQVILVSDNDDPIEITRGSTGTLADLASLGFRENSEAGVLEGTGIATPTNAWGVGDVTINGTAISATDTDSLQGKVDNINDVTDETGVVASTFSSATLDFSGVVDTDIAAEADVLVNGVTVDLSGVDATDTVQDVVDAFNAVKDSTGVTASLLGSRVVLEGNVSAITLTDGAVGAWDDLGTAGVQLTEGTGTAGAVATDDVIEGGIKLVSTSGNPISVEIGDSATAADIGLIEANATSEGAFGSALNTISISTAAGAQKAIDVIDNALETINNTRSELGAVSNRLDFTVNNLSSISENVSAAQSQIVDADYAEESAALSRARGATRKTPLSLPSTNPFQPIFLR